MAIHDDVISTVSLEFSAVAREKSSSGHKLISLGLGEPGFDTPKDIIDAAFRSMVSGESRYSSPWGLPELLSSINKKIKIATGIDRKNTETVVTIGAKQSLTLALTSILEPGDEVIIFSPCYVSFKPQVLLAEYSAKVIELDLDELFEIDIDKFKSSISFKTKAVLLNFPNNPTGKIITHEKQQVFVDICKEKNLFIISDDIYSQLLFSGEKFYSFGTFWNDYEKIFVIDCFSKAYSMTGCRICYLSGPETYIKKCVTVQQHTITNIPVFIQRAAIAALNLDENPSENYKIQLSDNEKYLKQVLESTKDVEYVRSQGGMFCFLKINKNIGGSDQFCSGLLKKYSVAATPGKLFGASWDRYVRVSLGVTRDEFKEGIDLLVKYVKEI